MGPLESEKVLDGVKKDLTIENLLNELELFKSRAFSWEPQISIENNPNKPDVVFKLILGDKRNPKTLQGISYTLTKQQVQYFADGSVLLEDVVSNLVTLYEARLKELIRPQITNLVASVNLQNKGTGKW